MLRKHYKANYCYMLSQEYIHISSVLETKQVSNLQC